MSWMATAARVTRVAQEDSFHKKSSSKPPRVVFFCRRYSPFSRLLLVGFAAAVGSRSLILRRSGWYVSPLAQLHSSGRHRHHPIIFNTTIDLFCRRSGEEGEQLF